MLNEKEIQEIEDKYKSLLKQQAKKSSEITDLVVQWTYFNEYSGDLNTIEYSKFLKKNIINLPINVLRLNIVFNLFVNKNRPPLIYNTEAEIIEKINIALKEEREFWNKVVDETMIPLEKDMVDYFSNWYNKGKTKDDFLDEVNYRYGDTMAKLAFITSFLKKNYEENPPKMVVIDSFIDKTEE